MEEVLYEFDGKKYKMRLPTAIYRSGTFIVENLHSKDGQDLFKTQGDLNLVLQLNDILINYDKNKKYDLSRFTVNEYCAIFIQQLFELNEPLINEEITNKLCSLVETNAEIYSLFQEFDKLNFGFQDSSLIHTPIIGSDRIGNDNNQQDKIEDLVMIFHISKERKVFLEKQFGSVKKRIHMIQLLELILYSFNLTLKNVQPLEQQQLLIFTLNVFNQMLKSQERRKFRLSKKAEDIEYLTSVFKNLILYHEGNSNVSDGSDSTSSNKKSVLEVVFVILVYSVGIFVPNILDNSANSQAHFPNFQHNNNGFLPNSKLSLHTSPNSITDTPAPQSTPVLSGGSAAVSFFSPSSTAPPSAMVSRQASSVTNSDAKSLNNRNCTEQEDDIRQFIKNNIDEEEDLRKFVENLKLNGNNNGNNIVGATSIPSNVSGTNSSASSVISRNSSMFKIHYRSEKPMLQHLKIPPARLAVLIRSKR